MHPLSEYATSVVRLEADYAGTVLWLMNEVPYEVTHLSAELIRDLEAWEEFFNGALTEDFEWRADDGHRHFIEEGRRLAQRLAEELGESFSVEFKSRGARVLCSAAQLEGISQTRPQGTSQVWSVSGHPPIGPIEIPPGELRQLRPLAPEAPQ